MDNTMKSVAFHNLGCKVNGYEMDYMQQNLQERGYIVVPFDTKADLYIINTCSVTNMADRKSRQMIHRAKKMNPDAVVVAVGCYVQTSTEAVSYTHLDVYKRQEHQDSSCIEQTGLWGTVFV